MVIISIVQEEVKCIISLKNKLKNKMFRGNKNLEKRIEMQLMRINDDYSENSLF